METSASERQRVSKTVQSEGACVTRAKDPRPATPSDRRYLASLRASSRQGRDFDRSFPEDDGVDKRSLSEFLRDWIGLLATPRIPCACVLDDRETRSRPCLEGVLARHTTRLGGVFSRPSRVIFSPPSSPVLVALASLASLVVLVCHRPDVLRRIGADPVRRPGCFSSSPPPQNGSIGDTTLPSEECFQRTRGLCASYDAHSSLAGSLLRTLFVCERTGRKLVRCAAGRHMTCSEEFHRVPANARFAGEEMVSCVLVPRTAKTGSRAGRRVRAHHTTCGGGFLAGYPSLPPARSSRFPHPRFSLHAELSSSPLGQTSDDASGRFSPTLDVSPSARGMCRR